ncbi:hypothetical protein LO771_27915 [Streptacidiphilus sp. ASG 303]|uniref:hypothetical protein n=1 Tax=Streptacidiphilus sp. ASG 303 TaxID=2896847 RepID=UPI001E6197F6|nr:hypothetical protein [Streptacidiphilus sp. ASG 303]MCD0486105.1 hypothetical protein [Streptacidiphilus sp. ASG 303]
MTATTVLTALGTPPPGVGTKLDTILGWITFVAAWSAGVAFVACGGTLCWAYFSGQGSSRAMKALGGACVGSVVISAAGMIANALLT